jgi:transcriptional regulator
MSIEELIAEELSKDARQDQASEPIQVEVDADGELVIDRSSRTGKHRPDDRLN